MIDLANGGFNRCIYGAWGPDSGSGHSSEDATTAAYVKGESVLTAVGYSICGDLMEGDTIVFGDYALWSAKEGFTMPEDGSSDTTPTPSNGSTEQPTNAATENATSAPSASATAGTSVPAPNNTVLYIVIAAVVVAVVVIIVVVISLKKKKAE